MTKGQEIALVKLQAQVSQQTVFHPTFQEEVNFAYNYIYYHPEYIDDNGNFLDEVAVDYKLGRINKPYIKI